MKHRRLIFPFLFFVSIATAQSPLDRKVSINVEEVSVEEALFKLIEQNDINVSFSNAIFEYGKTVSLHFSEVKLKYVLQSLLQDTGLSFEIVGQQVVLSKKATPAVQKKALISGYVTDADTGERIAGAIIYAPALQAGTYTNEYGFFSFEAPPGNHLLQLSYFGYKTDSLLIRLNGNTKLDLTLQPALLTEIIVNEWADSILIDQSRPGTITLNPNQLSRLPGLGGESDPVRIAYSLPGIQTGADGFGGISVRGGNVDQNLFLLDGVPVYNANHGIGIFSVYNSSSIRSAQVLTGAIPAQYGGRISSVWDFQTKEGNSNQFQGEGELGLTSGQLSFEGPLLKNRGSFFASGRRAFFDFYSVPITTKIRKKDAIDGAISYFFYDLNFKVNYSLTPKDKVYVSYYRGLDDYKDTYNQTRLYDSTLLFLANTDTVFWGNDVASVRWNRQFTEKLFSNTTLYFSRYFYQSKNLVDLELTEDGSSVLRKFFLSKYYSQVSDLGWRTDFDYSPGPQHRVRFGLLSTLHTFRPRTIYFNGEQDIDTIQVDTIGDWDRSVLESLESEIYAQDEFQLNKKWLFNLGCRLSTLRVGDKWYAMPQPRFLVQFIPAERTRFHFSFGRMTQFLHLLSSSSLGLPKDLWVSATERVPPQESWQLMLGFHKKLFDNWDLTLDGYAKTLRRILVFKGNFLERIDANNWQGDANISLGKGNAFGLEMLLKKQGKKWSGWLSYALAQTNRQFDRDINEGRKFPFRLDRRHNLNIQTLYQPGGKWSFSAAFTLTSGSAYTLPGQQYEFIQPPGSPPVGIVFFADVIDKLNGERLPYYSKIDLMAQYAFVNKKTNNILKFGVYNLLNRQNPLYITRRDKIDESGQVGKKLVQVSLVPIFPTIRYMLEFR
jgi:hypothetical protein